MYTLQLLKCKGQEKILEFMGWHKKKNPKNMSHQEISAEKQTLTTLTRCYRRKCLYSSTLIMLTSKLL